MPHRDTGVAIKQAINSALNPTQGHKHRHFIGNTLTIFGWGLANLCNTELKLYKNHEYSYIANNRICTRYWWKDKYT